MERPILLKAYEVSGILDGRQTQLRRIVKNQQPYMEYVGIDCKDRSPTWGVHDGKTKESVAFIKCPFGQLGDRLWGKETWQSLWAEAEQRPPYGLKSNEGWAVSYAATNGILEYYDEDDGVVARCKSSTQMPRWASRILLEIVGVRVERLQDISERDVKAQGIQGSVGREIDPAWLKASEPLAPTGNFLKDIFAGLWSHIHGQESWQASPWVWVVEFKRVDVS
ncbi:hypothetical protein HFO51_06580 [Rhizobium leguminosarum]|uniref:hypothetical protein n=1 Tax=Rhizobium leguminosarum TaxID=384 RepID=UPI001C960AEC|nr:hypothetical protein [Rhizobium leguminosarum]MBY5594134.1 hypothetical protein [Rhizobium leguminosarum]